ncbi:MAG: acid shock protein [Endomicrobiaceae bacterium]|nr:acid shock protein [Endomicrobiaceae bacterium]
MKKVLSLLVALFVSSSAFAASTFTTYTGIADFTGAGAADFHFNLKNVNGDAAVTNNTIAWTNTDAFNTTSADKWVRADQYAEVIANVTKAGFNVYMYQTNGQSTDYKAVDPRVNGDGTKPVSGLVRKGSNGGAFRGYVPLAFSFVPTKNASITFDGNEGDPTDARANRFFVDSGDKKADGTTSNFNKNYALIASLCGPVFGPFGEGGVLAPWCSKDVVNKTAYMYFFGNFHDIIGGDIFGTDQIKIEQVTE